MIATSMEWSCFLSVDKKVLILQDTFRNKFRQPTQSSQEWQRSEICWRLLTTHAVTTFEQAVSTAKKYRMRWYIEELFRLLKNKDFKIESSELETRVDYSQINGNNFNIGVAWDATITGLQQRGQ